MVGAAMPLVVQSGDRLQGIGLDDQALAGIAAGDLRLHGRARVAGKPGDTGLGAALAASILLPTGDDFHFAGEAGWMLSAIAVTLAVTQYNVFDQCLIALGKMRLLSALNFVRLIALYALIPLFYWKWGVKGAIIAVPTSAVANVVILLAVQARLHLLDIKRELLVIPLFGAGVLAGWLVSLLLPVTR